VSIEQSDSRAEQRGRERDRELVDQAGVHVLEDRCAAARDTDVPIAGGVAGLVERVLDERARFSPAWKASAAA